MSTNSSNQRLARGIKWGLGLALTWKLLKPEAREGIRIFVNNEITEYNRRQAEIERQQAIQELQIRLRDSSIVKSEFVADEKKIPVASGTSISDSFFNIDFSQYFEKPVNPFLSWRKIITHPSVTLILGKRGSGKSALGYFLLEAFRYTADLYVVGAPEEARQILPEWIGIVSSLEDLPRNCVGLVDEAYISFHARGSMTARNQAMSKALNLSRQRGQTIIFVSQNSGEIDKNILGASNVIIFKELGMLQLEFDRPQIAKLITQAQQAFDSIQGDKKKWGYVYAPDANHLGLLENGMPSFWKPKLSRLFAVGPVAPTTRKPKSMTLEDRQRRAREMRAQGDSYGVIAKELGVSRGTAVNYVKGYPYNRDIK